MVVVLSKIGRGAMRVGYEQGRIPLACRPGRKLTALCYGSVSAIGNRVTDVTVSGVQGRASANKAKRCSETLSRCRSRDSENGFDREDVLWRAQRRWRQIRVRALE